MTAADIIDWAVAAMGLLILTEWLGYSIAEIRDRRMTEKVGGHENLPEDYWADWNAIPDRIRGHFVWLTGVLIILVVGAGIVAVMQK